MTTEKPPSSHAYASAEIDPDQIGWSDSTNGPENVFDQSTKEPSLSAQQSGQVEFQPPTPLKPPPPSNDGADNSGGDIDGDDDDVGDVARVRLRQERQSLRRLPRSGAVVFTIRTYLDPFTELAKESGVPGRLASAIRSWPEDVAELSIYSSLSLSARSDYTSSRRCRNLFC